MGLGAVISGEYILSKNAPWNAPFGQSISLLRRLGGTPKKFGSMHFVGERIAMYLEPSSSDDGDIVEAFGSIVINPL